MARYRLTADLQLPGRHLLAGVVLDTEAYGTPFVADARLIDWLLARGMAEPVIDPVVVATPVKPAARLVSPPGTGVERRGKEPLEGWADGTPRP